MANEGTLKSIWSFTDKHSIEAMKGEKLADSKFSSGLTSWRPCDSAVEYRMEGKKKQLKSDFESSECGYESDESQSTMYSDSVKDFAAIPVEFRPNIYGEHILHVPNKPPKNDSFDKRKYDNTKTVAPARSETVFFFDKVEASKTTPQPKEKAPSGVILNSKHHLKVNNLKSDEKGNENNVQTKKTMYSFRDAESDKRIKEKKTVSFHVPRQTEVYFTNLNNDSKRNEYKDGKPFREGFSNSSIETLSISDDMKSKKSFWDSNLSLSKEELQVRSSNNGCTRRRILKNKVSKPMPSAHDSKSGGIHKNIRNKCTEIGHEGQKSTDYGKGRNIAWDDNMFLFKSEENEVNLHNTSKDDNCESRTITPCWEKLNQRKALPLPRRNFIDNNKYIKYEGNKHCSESLLKNREVLNRNGKEETKKHLHSTVNGRVNPKNVSRSKRSKSAIIRDKVKDNHGNELNFQENYTSDNSKINDTRNATSKNSKDKDEACWHGFANGAVANNLFDFGINTKHGEKQVNPKQYTAPNCTTDCSSSVQLETGQHNLLTATSSLTKGLQNNLNTSKGNLECMRALLVDYGKEISDFIVGSYVGSTTFLSFFHVWLISRKKTISLLEELADNVSNLNKKTGTIKSVVDLFDSGGKIMSVVPDVRFAIAGKVITAITAIFSKFFKSSPNLKDLGMKESEMMRFLQEDIEATVDVYMYGIQCDQQFQETCKLIEKLQHCIDNGKFAGITGEPEADFLQVMLHFNPKNCVVYYKKLFKCFEKLKESKISDISRAFCRAFEDSPKAMAIIKQLHWRFHAKINDSETVQRSWEEVCILLQDSNSNRDILQKIRDCIRLLIVEQHAMERDVTELIKHKI